MALPKGELGTDFVTTGGTDCGFTGCAFGVAAWLGFVIKTVGLGLGTGAASVTLRLAGAMFSGLDVGLMMDGGPVSGTVAPTTVTVAG